MAKRSSIKGAKPKRGKAVKKNNPSIPMPSGNPEATLSAMPAELFIMILNKTLPDEKHLFDIQHAGAYLINSTFYATASNIQPPTTRFYIHLDEYHIDWFSELCVFLGRAKHASALARITSLRVTQQVGDGELGPTVAEGVKWTVKHLLQMAGVDKAVVHWEETVASSAEKVRRSPRSSNKPWAWKK
jgi:hypothetical protein